MTQWYGGHNPQSNASFTASCPPHHVNQNTRIIFKKTEHTQNNETTGEPTGNGDFGIHVFHSEQANTLLESTIMEIISTNQKYLQLDDSWINGHKGFNHPVMTLNFHLVKLLTGDTYHWKWDKTGRRSSSGSLVGVLDMVGSIVAMEVSSVSSFVVPASSKCFLISFPHFVLITVPSCS
jgi:hypothetical protein